MSAKSAGDRAHSVSTSGDAEPKLTGAELFAQAVEDQPADGYQPKGLPPIDKTVHSDALISKLKKPAFGN